MSSSTIYEYNVKSVAGSVAVDVSNPGAANAGLAVISELSPGDEFVFEGKVFTFAGGADSGSVGGPEVGFFAYAPNGSMHFFSLTEIAGTTTGNNLYLNTSQTDTICFMAGTRVATPTGSVNVEDLAAGDVVLTAEGKSVPVLWLGRQTVSTTFANPNRVLPIRIRAGALGEQLPARDLLVSPCHAILVDGVLVQAGALVNGSTVVRESDVPEILTYYHVETEDHSLILAEGVPAETFIDNVARLAFDNWDEHLERYPEGRSVPELDYPRAASARQVPAAVVARLAARADKVAGPLLKAA